MSSVAESSMHIMKGMGGGGGGGSGIVSMHPVEVSSCSGDNGDNIVDIGGNLCLGLLATRTTVLYLCLALL